MDDRDAPPRYRIEHRDPARAAAVVAVADRIGEALTLLDEHERRLAAEDAPGTLALVNQRRRPEYVVVSRPLGTRRPH